MSKRMEVEDYVQDAEPRSWVPKVLVLGAVIGAATGVLGAYLLIQRSKNDPSAPKLSTGEGMRLGVLLFGLLRQIQLLGDDE